MSAVELYVDELSDLGDLFITRNQNSIRYNLSKMHKGLVQAFTNSVAEIEKSAMIVPCGQYILVYNVSIKKIENQMTFFYFGDKIEDAANFAMKFQNHTDVELFIQSAVAAMKNDPIVRFVKGLAPLVE